MPADPLTLAVIAATAGKAAIAVFTKMSISAAAGKVKSGTKEILTEGPLAAELEKAFVDATSAFLEIFDVFDPNAQEKANLKLMVEDDEWGRALAPLPLLQPEKIDTSPCRELFSGLRPSQATDVFFDVGWPRLVAQFKRSVANSRSVHLQRFVGVASRVVPRSASRF